MFKECFWREQTGFVSDGKFHIFKGLLKSDLVQQRALLWEEGVSNHFPQKEAKEFRVVKMDIK